LFYNHLSYRDTESYGYHIGNYPFSFFSLEELIIRIVILIKCNHLNKETESKQKKKKKKRSNLPYHKAFAAQSLQQVTVYLVECSMLDQVLYTLDPKK
jgi:hypothetical protein